MPSRIGSTDPMGQSSITDDTSWVQRIGSFTLRTDKPLSSIWWAVDQSSLLKVYRGFDPALRRAREANALIRAGHEGLAVPKVLSTGDRDASSWTLLEAVPGEPLSNADLPTYIGHVEAVTAALQAFSFDLRPGDGWSGSAGRAVSNSDSLLQQLPAESRSRPWWTDLLKALAPLDRDPAVYLHGDIKPEHLLEADRTAYVVDWEASARGPAHCDHTHAAFHIVRDLIYAGALPHELPVEQIGRLQVPGALAAWRIVRWLAWRRPGDLDGLTRPMVAQLASLTEAAEVISQLALHVAHLRDIGIPR